MPKKKRKIKKERLFLLHKIPVLCHFVRGNITVGMWHDVPQLIINQRSDT